MQRYATTSRPTATLTGMPPSRSASYLRSPQQVIEIKRKGPGPDGLAPGVVRRVSAVAEAAAVTPEAVCAPSEIPVEMPQRLTPVDFCRQARRLRAVHDGDPKRKHEQLSELSGRGTEAERNSAAQAAPEPERPVRKGKSIRWTWTQTAKLGKSGVSLLGKLGMGLSMAAEEAAPAPAAVNMEDDEPQYTLVDPEDPLPDDQGYANTNDRSFAALVNRTMRSQHTAVLRYSQRLELLKEAGARGIGRFEANLIIASVQHRLSSGMPLPKQRRPIRLQSVLAFVLMQGMILWGFWRIFKS